MCRGVSCAFVFNGKVNWKTNVFNPIADAGVTEVTLNAIGSTWRELQIAAARVHLGANHVLPTGSPVAINNASGALYLDGFNQQIGGLSGTSGVVVNHATNAHSTLTIQSTTNWTYDGALVLSGISGAKQFGLDLAGGGLTLSSTANSFAGPTVIRSGATLALTNNGTIQISPIEIQAGGVFDVSGRTEGIFTVSSSQVISGDGIVQGSLTNNGTIAPAVPLAR